MSGSEKKTAGIRAAQRTHDPYTEKTVLKKPALRKVGFFQKVGFLQGDTLLIPFLFPGTDIKISLSKVNKS